MSTYIMSDIHGCYDDFMQMLRLIDFSSDDSLIITGDIIDRGAQTYEMMKWAENCPKNVTLLRGNHEEEFIGYVKLMLIIDHEKKLRTGLFSNEDAMALYDAVEYYVRTDKMSVIFDYYETIIDLIKNSNVTLSELVRWAELFESLDYYKKININGREYVAVHAGYTEDHDKISKDFSDAEDFYIYAREESIMMGGIENAVIISGHTPTITQDGFFYNNGNAFRYYDAEKNCIFYDIDCGCVFRSFYDEAKLACMRLEDESFFYV